MHIEKPILLQNYITGGKLFYILLHTMKNINKNKTIILLKLILPADILTVSESIFLNLINNFFKKSTNV